MMNEKDPREMALEAVEEALGMGKMKSVLGDDFGMPKKKSGVTIIVIKGDARDEVPMVEEEDGEEDDLEDRLEMMGE